MLDSMLEGSSLLGKAVVAFESVTEYAAVIAAEFVGADTCAVAAATRLTTGSN